MQEQNSKFTIKQPIRTVHLDNLKIGSDTSFHFLTENENVSKSLYALELNIFNPHNSPQVVQNAFLDVLNDPVKTIQKAQTTSCDILGLKFNIDENINSIKPAKELLKELLPHITKPLMIRGINNSEIDSILLPELMSVLDRQAIIAFAEEKSYKNIVPSVVKGEHILVIRTLYKTNAHTSMSN